MRGRLIMQIVGVAPLLVGPTRLVRPEADGGVVGKGSWFPRPPEGQSGAGWCLWRFPLARVI